MQKILTPSSIKFILALPDQGQCINIPLNKQNATKSNFGLFIFLTMPGKAMSVGLRQVPESHTQSLDW